MPVARLKSVKGLTGSSIVPHQKLNGPVCPLFHSPKSHWFSVGREDGDRSWQFKCRQKPGRTERGARWNAKLRLFGEGMLGADGGRYRRKALLYTRHSIR